MKTKRLLNTARRSLGAHKTRTVLATLGITIGVAAVVAVGSLGEGTKAELLATIDKLGANLLVVSAGRTQAFAGRQQRATDATTLTLEDCDALAEEVPELNEVVPAHRRQASITWEDQTATTTVVATLPAFQEVCNFHPTSGEFFDDEMVKATQRVVVLGRTVVDTLFGNDDPLGARVRLNRTPFTVIGVMEAKGLDLNGQDQDDQVFIPLTTGLRRLFNVTWLTTIFAQAADRKSMTGVQADSAALLRERHRLHDGEDDDFTVQSQTEIAALQTHTSNAMTLLVSSVGGISLLVGGVGILAVMLISVRERRREIGLRRAVGATRRDIRVQFLAEAALLSVGGSLGGVLLGMVAAAVTARFTHWGAVFPFPAAIGSMIVSAVIGIGFGWYPARRAAQLNPIEALRAE